ncbi:aldehyde dehydrogenase family protein [Burkholderia lata]|uniref:aldehyde dehydrogenase family protein n=1 Tax=Burkholderia lata (strain ATCC 17760 / DSM 23089 / LMG 22485 / NCIMB 9086 / R18194 / 383) TaxID=482957 RepID=UPI003D341B07
MGDFACYNAGQDCTVSCRLYVPGSIDGEVVSRISATAGRVVVGGSSEPESKMGRRFPRLNAIASNRLSAELWRRGISK